MSTKDIAKQVAQIEQVRHMRNAGYISTKEARAHVEAITDTPPANDRSVCKPWCGLPLLDRRVPPGGEQCGVFIERDARGNIVKSPAGSWCTARCRHLKAGPLEAKAVAEHPPRIIGYEHYREAFARAFCPPTMTWFRADRGASLAPAGTVAAWAPAPPPDVICPCCKVTSLDGKAHLDRCEVPQPSAVAAAPRPFVFVPSVSEWDLLPDADR